MDVSTDAWSDRPRTTFEFPRSGSERYYDTVVSLSHCDQFGDPGQYVEFLRNLRLVSAADNSEAYSARGYDVAYAEHGEPQEIGGGTGFFVSDRGYILTNNHVIDECSAVHAQQGEVTQEVTIVAADPWNDLALLRRSNPAPDEVAFLRGGRDADAGEEVMAVGFPYGALLGSQPKVTTGIISATVGIEDDSRAFQTTAPIQPGNSGGPLLDRSGNVVGVIEASLDDFAIAEATGSLPQNVNFAIKASVIRAFLDTHRIEYRTATLGAERESLALANIGREITVALVCFN